MALNLRLANSCNVDNDDNVESEKLPTIVFEENRFPMSLFGHRIAMNSGLINTEQLLRSLSNLEMAVARYFEWVAGIPELRLMDMQEKVTLIVRQMNKVILLMISYWTYRHAHNGIVFGTGICYNPSEVQDNTLETYLSPFASVIHNNIISVFRKVAMTREEYLLLKIISFFDCKWLNF
ncbi:hypothetical protein GCK32_008088 [Trichostrongylus colubriformis]|uniref:NR LBD domain-containing protein n=1 Tax=Trichostrongylus colubriformis TaxID=6319 RepID=A0AAN8I9W1_TRICO